MKLIGVDYGRRRIGLAVTDDEGRFVRGLATIDRQKTNTRAAIVAVVETEKPAAIVVGLPLDSDDNETAMSLEIRNFFANLEKTLSLPVYYIDESLTSKHAAVLLQHRRKKDRQDKAAVDRIAACLILDSFLGEQAPGSHPDL